MNRLERFVLQHAALKINPDRPQVCPCVTLDVPVDASTTAIERAGQGRTRFEGKKGKIEACQVCGCSSE